MRRRAGKGIGLVARRGRGDGWARCTCGLWGGGIGLVVVGVGDLVGELVGDTELGVEGETESAGWVESVLGRWVVVCMNQGAEGGMVPGGWVAGALGRLFVN